MAERESRAGPGGGAAAPGDGPRRLEVRQLMKQVEEVVGALGDHRSEEPAVWLVADAIIDRFRDQLGIFGGRLYRRRGSSYVLEATFGDAADHELGVEVPADYPPVELLLERRTLFMDGSEERLDPDLERRLGAAGKFAAIEVDDGNHLLAFDIAPGHSRDDLLHSLGILRHAINLQVREERWVGIVRQAREIQSSILPRRAPEHEIFDVAGRTESLESVGGDYYTYVPITDKILGLALADVSGHGLPAALQVRDIHVGLRMGLSQDLKIVRTVERLNRIIHDSTMTSRFVSLFYGELELNGLFIYVNAGHPPPFVLTAGGERIDLEEGGTVLGPVADASYDRGFVMLRPGDVLVLYTDGITEAHRHRDGHGEELGVERLAETVRAHAREPAERIVEAVFRRVEAFSGDGPAEDDRTVVVVRAPDRGE